MDKVAQLKKLLTSSERIAITVHKRPDGDAIGSGLALARLCHQLGNDNVRIISPTVYPKFLTWMPGVDKIVIAEKSDPKNIQKMLHEVDLLFCLDFGAYHRLGNIAEEVRTTPAQKVIIDHHPDRIDIEGLTISAPTAPATALILYDLFVEMGFEKLIDETLATALYLGIATDTGFFSNSNTSASAHRVAAKLVEKGIDISSIHYHLQGNTPLRKLRFIAHIIQHRLVIFKKHNFAYFAIPRSDFRNFKINSGETGGLVRYVLNIQGITLAILLTEQKEAVHLSFRSFGQRAVNKLATEHFNGGGHKNAAGGIFHGSLQDAEQKLKELLSCGFLPL